MGYAYNAVASAKRPPNDDPPETIQEAEAALAAGYLDIFGIEYTKDRGPSELAAEMHRRFPGFQDWMGTWHITESGLANSAWTLAITATKEVDFAEEVGVDGLVR